jgi:hypothetical protein
MNEQEQDLVTLEASVDSRQFTLSCNEYAAALFLESVLNERNNNQ